MRAPLKTAMASWAPSINIIIIIIIIIIVINITVLEEVACYKQCLCISKIMPIILLVFANYA